MNVLSTGFAGRLKSNAIPFQYAQLIDDFLAAVRLWRWQRQMEGKPIGDLRSGRPCRERDRAERIAAAVP